MLSGLRGRLEPPKKSHRWPQLNQAAAEGPNKLAADQARSPSLFVAASHETGSRSWNAIVALSMSVREGRHHIKPFRQVLPTTINSAHRLMLFQIAHGRMRHRMSVCPRI
jgi:hypothetical protein